MLQLTDICLERDEPVLKNFSLTLQPGTTVLITGPSGKGKTTIFSVILGFAVPQEGTVIYNSIKLNASTVQWFRTHIGYLPQNPLPLKGNLYENIRRVFSFAANRSLAPDRKAAEERLEMLGLSSSVLDKNTEDLSGGQRQKAGLVLLSLLSRPLNLLDEPVSSLDPDSLRNAGAFIKEFFPHSLIISHVPEIFDYAVNEVKL